MRLDREDDPRLLGGIVQRLGPWAGVLYNADGQITEALATPFNTTVAILTRNRCDYLQDLLESIDASAPPSLARLVIVNNTTDETLDVLRQHFPHWRACDVRREQCPPMSQGLDWLRRHRTHLLPPKLRSGLVSGYGPTESVAWLRNKMLLECKTRFLISFDDDFIVKPGWLEYLLAFQQRHHAFGVINNFGAFLLDRAVIHKVGWFDERFLRSHGYEDNDMMARINEARLKWVLGFNPEHDWRSAEEGNPRGSGTGCDLFVHRYAKQAGGYSASREEEKANAEDSELFGNGRWYAVKWRHAAGHSGILDRPPFKGYFLERLEGEEPAWHSADWSARPNDRISTPNATASGAKVTQNTPGKSIDPFDHPATTTMVDRYVFFSHWCKGKAVLDAGCGHGYGSVLLRALGAGRVVGIDSDVDAINSTRSNHGREELEFEIGNLLNIDARHEGTFDAVVCAEVFEHVDPDEVPKLLDGLRACLKEGGTLILTTPRRKTAEWHGGGGTHLYEYSPSEFRRAIYGELDDAKVRFTGIQEFQVRGHDQWFSLWREPLDDDVTVMVTIAEQVPRRDRKYTKRSPPLFQTRDALPRMSLLISNRNTLAYLKLALKSCREYLARPDHEIIVYDDASSDGSLAWLNANKENFRLRILSHSGPERKGIVYVYDELVQAASEPLVFLIHSDMFFARSADAELWRHFGPGMVGTCTRIEPPIHSEETCRVTKDFGLDPASFQEEAFLRFAEKLKDSARTTQGIFAPVLVWRDDFLSLGGHDKIFAPQSREDSDLFNRMALAGLRFVQSWSSFCYHFSGRGSRRKDTPMQDSDEWRRSNAKNERNFIRKWGTSVRHDQWLLPQVVSKSSVTLVGLLGNEAANVLQWLAHLEPYVDEIVLVNDSTDGSEQLARKYINEEASVSPLVSPEKLKILPRSLGGDYGAARNAGQDAATHEWVFHVDLDERLPQPLLEGLQELLVSLNAEGKQVCGFPRANLLNGILVNDIPRSEWTPDQLKTLALEAPPRQIKNPDIQFRLVRRSIRWVNRVHEVPEPVAAQSRGASVAEITVCKSLWIVHEKTLLKQAQQDLTYRMLVGPSGPHGSWNPKDVLEQLERNSAGGIHAPKL